MTPHSSTGSIFINRRKFPIFFGYFVVYCVLWYLLILFPCIFVELCMCDSCSRPFWYCVRDSIYEVRFQTKYSSAYRWSGMLSEHLRGYLQEYLKRSNQWLIDALVSFFSVYLCICVSI